MASIVDSFSGVFTDRLSLLKLFVLALPVYYSYQVFTTSKGDFSYFYIVAGITLILFLGFLTKVTFNVINEKDAVLPSLNPLKLFATGLKCLIAIGPLAAISAALANGVCSFINIIFWLDMLLKTVIWLIVGSLILTSFLMFSTKERISNAYKFKVLFEKAGELIFVILFFIIQLLIINIPTSGFIAYTLLVLFGFGPVFDAFITFAVVFNIAVVGHYLGQVHYEVVSYNKN